MSTPQFTLTPLDLTWLIPFSLINERKVVADAYMFKGHAFYFRTFEEQGGKVTFCTPACLQGSRAIIGKNYYIGVLKDGQPFSLFYGQGVFANRSEAIKAFHALAKTFDNLFLYKLPKK